MEVLYVSNSSVLRCGVAQYGRHCAWAAHEAGVSITDWDATHPMRLPPNAEDFDRIHLNWHATTIGHLQAADIPKGPRLSIFVHEPLNHPSRDLLMRADVLLAAEPRDGYVLFENPCPDYRPSSDWAHLQPELREVVIGESSVRKSGADRLQAAVEWHNRELASLYEIQPGEVLPGQWRISNASTSEDSWLSDEAEIERLAGCTLNIAHYHGGYSGQSYGVMMLVAARRPVLINSNQQFSGLFDCPDVYRIEDPKEGIETILRDIAELRERRPLKLAEERRWSRRVQQLKSIWEAL